MVSCFIGLGANLGERKKNINQALKLLKQDPEIKVLKVSSLIETEPQGCSSAQPRFLNGAVKISTGYSARELLLKLQEIEVKLGRVSPRRKNQPRAIDLDILTFGDSAINQQDLQIPHPRMRQREFVRIPLQEIAPELFG